MAPTAAVVTVSDRGARGEREDKGGPAIVARLQAAGFRVVRYQVTSDDAPPLRRMLVEMADRQGVDLIVTTGGTGLGPRDRVPEVAGAWADYAVPGFGELVRAATGAGNPRAFLSRGGAWVRGRTLLVALPGNPRAVDECLDVLVPLLDHGLHILRGGDHPHPG